MNTWLRRTILAAALMAGLVPVMAQVPPPVPGLPDTERRTPYSLVASNCACSVGFALYGDSTDYQDWLEVFINGTQVTYNDPVFGWTITSPTGPLATIARPITDGVLTFNSVQTGTVQIVGARRPRRVSQFNENTGVPARNLNQALTDIVAQNREVWDKINDVTGRIPRAPPGETMATLPPAASRANQNVCFDSGGNMVPCINLVGTSSFSAGNGIKFTGTNPTVISALLAGSGPIVVTPGATDTIGCPTCNTVIPPTSNNALVSTRAAATALNLSAYNVVTTQGYTTPGDGGGATYQNVGSAGFIDSTPTFSLTTAGTGCTTITAVLQGFVANTGLGVGTLSLVTISGGSVTSAPFSSPGGGYAVGQTVHVSPNLAGCSVQPVWTVASVSSPTCSFIDSAGTHFQEVINGNRINAQACGVKNDWNVTSGDAGSTNNTTPLQSALWFAYVGLNTVSNHNINQGAIVVLPPKTTMTCAFNLPEGVTLEGAGRYSTNLKDCDSEPAASNFITVGDSTLLISCFGSMIRDLGIEPGAQTNTPNSGTAIIFSNCIQQQTFLDRVLTSGGGRSCVSLQVGYGGAEGIGLHDVECGTATSVNPGMAINYASAILDMNHIVIENGINLTAAGLSITSGSVNLRNFHSEGYSNAISMNVSANNGLSSFHNIGGGAGCTNLILRQGGSAANVNVIGMATPGSCTNTLNNAGTITTGNIIADAVF